MKILSEVGSSLSYEEKIVESADLLLKRILQQEPILKLFIAEENINNAKRVIKNIRSIITKDPKLVEELDHAHTQNPNHVTMLISSHEKSPFILARTLRGLSASVPVFSCTLRAMDTTIRKNPNSNELYCIASSDKTEEELSEFIFNTTNENSENILIDNSGVISAKDFVALAATGMLKNEFFGVNFPNKL